MAERGVLVVLIILLAVLVFAQPDLSWPIRRFLDRGRDLTSVERLAIENSALRAENTLLRERMGDIPEQFSQEQAASVFVRYPFNYKKEIIISAGSRADVRQGDTVLLPDMSSENKRGILIGRVESVEENSAMVQLIYDSRLRMGVRIGGAGTEALLVGGDSPKLTLIPKNAEIKSGDIVFAAYPSLPYGIVVGEVADVGLSNGGLLQEATLRFPYELGDIRNVVVVR